MRDYKEQAQAAGFLFLKGALKLLLFSQHFGLGLNLRGRPPGSPKGPPNQPMLPTSLGSACECQAREKNRAGG